VSDKVILLTINDKANLYGVTKPNSAVQPNIYMGLIDSYLTSKGIKTWMVDETLNLSIKDMVRLIEKDQPILFGVICMGANPSSSTMSMVGAIRFFEELKKHKISGKSFIQGGHPSVLPERTLKETGADFVIVGEGYKTIEQLYHTLMNDGDYSRIKGLAYGNVNTGFPELIDAKDLPPIDWTWFNPNKYKAHNWHCFGDINNRSPYGVVWTSLGCPYQCSFCCINNVFGKRAYRMRDMRDVISEIDLLVTIYGVKNIKIIDELFITNHPRIDEFCDGLKERGYDLNMWCFARMDTVTPRILEKLRGVGMRWIAYGMESTSKKVLGDIGKGCNRDKYDEVIKFTKDADLYIAADLIGGLWLDDRESLEDSYQWAVGHNFEWLNLYPAFAFPGTPLYEQYIKEGRMTDPKSWDEYSLYGTTCKPLRSKYLSSEEILRWRDAKFREYHSRPEYLSMIYKKFGIETHNHIVDMTKQKLTRNLLHETV